MSIFFSFVVLFATFFAVTAEEFDPRDYIPDGYNCIEYWRIMPDNPMLAYYASSLLTSVRTFNENSASPTNLAPTVSDVMTLKKIKITKHENGGMTSSCGSAYSLYYSKDGLAAEQYDFMKKPLLKNKSSNSKEEVDEKGVRLVKSNRGTIVLLSDNFIYRQLTGRFPALENNVIMTNDSNDTVKPVSDFVQKNPKNKDSFKDFNFSPETIYFSIVTPDLHDNSAYIIRNFPAGNFNGDPKIPDYVKYISTAITYKQDNNVLTLTLTVLCDTKENAKILYNSILDEAQINFSSKRIHANGRNLETTFEHGISDRTVFLKCSFDANKISETGKQEYEYHQCNNRMFELKRILDNCASGFWGSYPVSLQQLDIQNLIASPELLTCPSNGEPYIYLGSGETKRSMKKYEHTPLVMDRNFSGNHFNAVGENWNYTGQTKHESWNALIKSISSGNPKRYKFIRKKLTDYEKINIDAE